MVKVIGGREKRFSLVERLCILHTVEKSKVKEKLFFLEKLLIFEFEFM